MSKFLELANVHVTLTRAIDRLDSDAVSGTDVIQWGSPVPSFGDLSVAQVATLGINPSNREFMDKSGNELQGAHRRFHTLNSLGLTTWSDADARHMHLILESCRSYFVSNPYDSWFRKLDTVISGTNSSYYQAPYKACHLDLIPYATTHKWTELTQLQRSSLLNIARDTLGLLLRDSPVRLLILNGRAVVERFEHMAGFQLDREEVDAWSLPRQSLRDVKGVAYKGTVESLSGIAFNQRILVLGFNHNIQSSFGVTTEVMHSIRNWVAMSSKDVIS